MILRDFVLGAGEAWLVIGVVSMYGGSFLSEFKASFALWGNGRSHAFSVYR